MNGTPTAETAFHFRCEGEATPEIEHNVRTQDFQKTGSHRRRRALPKWRFMNRLRKILDR